jgi:hypothetical protein
MHLKDENILAIVIMSLALGILMGRFFLFEYAGFSVAGFLEGVLIGLSLVTNIIYLMRRKNGCF